MYVEENIEKAFHLWEVSRKEYESVLLWQTPYTVYQCWAGAIQLDRALTGAIQALHICCNTTLPSDWYEQILSYREILKQADKEAMNRAEWLRLRWCAKRLIELCCNNYPYVTESRLRALYINAEPVFKPNRVYTHFREEHDYH